MSSLVEELQRNIINEAIPMSTALRQIKLAAAKLHLVSVEDWVGKELDGYGESAIPKYRVLRGVPRAFNPYNGWIPLHFGDQEAAAIIAECPLYHSLSVLEGWVDTNKKGSLHLTFSPAKEAFLRERLQFDFEMALHVDVSSVRGVLAAVRNKALDWVIELEKHGVVGKEFSFTEIERDRAGAMTINNTFENLTGVFGNNNTSRDITSGLPPSQISAIIREARRYSKQLVEDGVDEVAFDKAIEQLDAAKDADDKGLVAKALGELKQKLAEAGGSAAAAGLLHMIQSLLS